jgi:hypothetical protein
MRDDFASDAGARLELDPPQPAIARTTAAAARPSSVRFTVCLLRIGFYDVMS